VVGINYLLSCSRSRKSETIGHPVVAGLALSLLLSVSYKCSHVPHHKSASNVNPRSIPKIKNSFPSIDVVPTGSLGPILSARFDTADRYVPEINARRGCHFACEALAGHTVHAIFQSVVTSSPTPQSSCSCHVKHWTCRARGCAF
jgi:hypothetical protein